MLSQSQARLLNLPCDWLSTAWSYSEQETENGPWSAGWVYASMVRSKETVAMSVIAADVLYWQAICPENLGSFHMMCCFESVPFIITYCSDLFHYSTPWLNTLSPKQHGRHFPDNIFKCIFLNEHVKISIKISLKFVPKGPINIIPALVQIMAWRRPGDKPLSEPMMVNLLTHICVTRPQWVKLIES